MGVYKITNRTHSGRPVWQSTVRDDRYLFYNGMIICLQLLCNHYVISIYEGNKSEWIIRKEASNGGAYIKSMKRGLVYIPVRGWQYADASIWQDDDTLTVTGKKTSCPNMIQFKRQGFLNKGEGVKGHFKGLDSLK